MQFTAATVLAFLAASAIAAPSQVEKRQFEAQLTFTGGTPDDTYTISAPTRPGSSFTIGT